MRPDHLVQPHPGRFAPERPDYDACLAAHEAALAAGRAAYPDPATGLYVWTAAYLLDRDWCCDGGCRHCPYVGASFDDGSRTDRDDPIRRTADE